jgi:Flp pilus assembly protein protease CpaA
MTTSQLTIVMGILLVIGIFNLRHQEKKAKKKEAFMAEQRKKILGE